MWKSFRKTLRFQIGAIVSLVLVILLAAVMSMHMVSVRYDREVLADKQEKLKVISQGLSSSLTRFIENGQNSSETTNYFGIQANAIVQNTPRLIVGVYLPYMDIRSFYGKGLDDRQSQFLSKRLRSQEDDEFFDIKVSEIREGKSFVRDGPGGIFLGRAEPILIAGHVKGAVLMAESVQGGVTIFRQITRIVNMLVFGSLIAGVIATIWVLARLKRGVRQITNGLAAIENDVRFRLSPPASGELSEISAAINNMAEVIEQKSLLEEQLERSSRLAALGHLVAGVAHEIRNPLGIMKATVQVMQDEYKNQESIQEYLSVLNEQVDRQNKVIRELLDYSKPVPPIFQPINVNEIIKSVLSFSKSYFQQHNVSLESAFAENLSPVNVDVEKLKQVFLNLIFNAVEAMPDGGSLELKTFCHGDMVVIEFIDNGRGIPETDIARLFDPFFTTKTIGTGLGLSTVHKIMEIHGGRIEVTSEVGKGTVVRIILPAYESEEVI